MERCWHTLCFHYVGTESIILSHFLRKDVPMSDRKDVQSNIRIFRSFAQLLALSFELSKQSDDDKSDDEYEKQQNAYY